MSRLRIVNYAQLGLAMIDVPFFPDWSSVAGFVFCLGMFIYTRQLRKKVE